MSNNGILQAKNTKYLPANTTTYNITQDDDFIFVDTSLNAVTLVLPNIRNGLLVENPKCFKINDYSGNAATHNITIVGCGGDSVNSGASFVMTSNYESVEANVVNPDEWFTSSSIGNTPTTGFVPYTGATQNVNLGSYGLSSAYVNSVYYTITGTAGSGYMAYIAQSVPPSKPATGFNLYGGSSNTVNWISPNGFITRLDSTANTNDRTYTFPDASGTIALTSSLSGYVPYTGATQNVDLGVYSLTTPQINGVASLLTLNSRTKVLEGTSDILIGERSAGNACIWFGQSASPTTTNFAFGGSSTGVTIVNGAGTIGTINLRSLGSNIFILNGAATSGNSVAYNFTPLSVTGQTAAETNTFKIDPRGIQFTTGATIALQRSNYFRSNVYTATAATQTVTDLVNGYFEADTASTNLTATNNWALWSNGNFRTVGSAVVTVDLTVPSIIGGTAVGSSVTYKSTSGTGTTTAIAHTFVGGTNGGTTLLNLYNDGQIIAGGGTTRNPTSLGNFRIAQSTSIIDMGLIAASQAAVWLQKSTPSTTNYTMTADAATTIFNGVDNVIFATGGTERFRVNRPQTSGTLSTFIWSSVADTGMTAGTNIPKYKFTGGSTTWAAGTLATQYFNYFTANTVAFASASTATNVYGLYVEAATAGANATITNNWAAGFSGAISVIGGKILMAASTTSYPSYNMPSGTAPTSPVDGDVWYDSTQKGMIAYRDGIKQYDTTTIFSQTQAVTVANTVAETALTGTGVGTLTLPANFFVAGKTIRITGFGIHSAVSNPNITVTIKLGSVTIVSTGVVVSANSTNSSFRIHSMITCYTTGATGTIWGQGIYTEAGAGANTFSMANTAATTVDTTASQTMSITVTWGTASASNTITMTNLQIEVLA